MYTAPTSTFIPADTFDGPTGAEAEEAAAAVLDTIECDEEFARQWGQYDLIFPGSRPIWFARFQRLLRKKQFDAVIEMIEARDFSEDLDPLAALEKAELLYSARSFDRADAVYGAIIEALPERRDIRIDYAKRLHADGFLAKAYSVIAPLDQVLTAGSKGASLCNTIMSLHKLLTDLEGREIAIDEDARLLSMKHAILMFANREVPAAKAPGLGRLSLITGSLGPGGAERQLSRVAVELERARKKGLLVGGVELSRPVEVIVRSHGPEKQNDFYLKEIRDEGVEISQLNDVTPISPKALGVEDPTLLLLLGYLPPSLNYGVKRLTQHLKDSETDTASAWQDGACLFASLPALLAGVTHIQFAIRGLPPSMRKHLFRPEYEVMYRAMAQVPGVTFISNNKASARAYAEWLDIPVDRFGIVYNGVEPMPSVSTPENEALWNEFVAATSDATHTVGAVFRFETDKQPNLWIRFAARYLKAHPNARMVMVGGGRLLPAAKQLAEELGIADRILFTDRSKQVGYWMTKMDVMLLLSIYEGLPNVLIEAQYMGVRVVTTPAGGAGECLIHGTTGYVLECVHKPCLDNIVAKANELAERAGDRELFAEGGRGRQFLDENFSVPTMLGTLARCTANALRSDEQLLTKQAA